MSIPVSDAPLALLYEAAISGINDELQPGGGKRAIPSAASGDPLPEATASRIVGQSAALYDTYRDQHRLQDNAAAREQFAALIRRGFETGFKNFQQAQGGQISADIERTCELVMLGLRDFATVEYSQPGGPTPLPDPV